MCTTDDASALIEQLQFDLGEGPCVDACQQDRPVLEPDLAAPTRPRWVAFTGPAVEAGVRAIFGFPLRVGAVRLGALNLYSDRPGPLTDDQQADALALADVAAQAVVAMQANAPPGRLAQELEAGGDFQYVVHQASGMVAAQLEVSVGQALIRLRAHAFGNDRPLTRVAEDVVARRLRFGERSGEKDPSREANPTTPDAGSSAAARRRRVRLSAAAPALGRPMADTRRDWRPRCLEKPCWPGRWWSWPTH